MVSAKVRSRGTVTNATPCLVRTPKYFYSAPVGPPGAVIKHFKNFKNLNFKNLTNQKNHKKPKKWGDRWDPNGQCKSPTAADVASVVAAAAAAVAIVVDVAVAAVAFVVAVIGRAHV